MGRIARIMVIFLFCFNFCQHSRALRRSINNTTGTQSDSDQTRFQKHGLFEDSHFIDLSYNECTQDGSCKIIKKVVQHRPPPVTWDMKRIDAPSRRIKRGIYGVDNRQRIWWPFNRYYPFTSAVAIRSNSTRCSGVAVRRDMFLTAAHCVKPISGEPVSNIEVGVISGRDTMKWTPVETTKVHVKWEGRTDSRRFLYNYAIVQTSSKLRVRGMKIAMIGRNGKSKDILSKVKPRMFFSAFDDDQVYSMLRYRNCLMKRVTESTIYSKCDTVAETAGAGVYLNVRDRRNTRGERKIIAIDSGRDSNSKRRFSSALRISRRRFAQICYWITDNYGECEGTEI